MISFLPQQSAYLNNIKGLSLLMAVVLVILDQITKYQIRSIVAASDGHIELLPFLNLVEVWNYGISFGMFQAGSQAAAYALIALALLITCLFAIWLVRGTHSFQILACGFVIGGAIGNVIDRFVYGAVYDFIDIHAYGYHWPAFNVADSAVFIGVAMIIIDGVFSPKDKGDSP